MKHRMNKFCFYLAGKTIIRVEKYVNAKFNNFSTLGLTACALIQFEPVEILNSESCNESSLTRLTAHESYIGES